MFIVGFFVIEELDLGWISCVCLPVCATESLSCLEKTGTIRNEPKKEIFEFERNSREVIFFNGQNYISVFGLWDQGQTK